MRLNRHVRVVDAWGQKRSRGLGGLKAVKSTRTLTLAWPLLRRNACYRHKEVCFRVMLDTKVVIKHPWTTLPSLLSLGVKASGTILASRGT